MGSTLDVGKDLVCEEMGELVRQRKVVEVVEVILNRLHYLLLPLSKLLVERCIQISTLSTLFE